MAFCVVEQIITKQCLDQRIGIQLVMNQDEAFVKEFLLHSGWEEESLVPQPKGQRTPDFAINGEIAVEVRRLSKHFHNGDKVEPLEHTNIRIHRFLTNIFDSFLVDHFDRSCFVSYTFERPIKPSKELREKIVSTLRSYLPNLGQRQIVKVHNNLTLEFLPTETKFDRPYLWGAASDDNGGGFVVSDLYKNLPIAVREKEEKVRQYFHEYGSWWLAIVDYIGYGLGELDLRQFNANPPIKTIFNKIILVSPWNPKWGSEIKIETIALT